MTATTASIAFALIRAQLEASGSGISIPLRWQGEDAPALPDTPTSFAYIVFNNQGSGRAPAAYGGGAGNNLYRNRCLIEAFTFAPEGEGLTVALDAAETIAARLRSFRSGDVSCFAASVRPIGLGSGLAPPGLSSAVDNYQCAVAEIAMSFDQIG